MKHRFYYSSHSIHLLNKLESLKKKRSRGDTVYQDCVNKRESEFLESVELDKISLLTNLDNCSIADSFKILKLLSSPTPIPSSINWEKTCASNDLAKANLSYHYFASVFIPSCIRENDSIVLAEIKLSDVKLSLENISHALKRCPNSNAVSYDLFPSSLLRKCYECLMPFAYPGLTKMCNHTSHHAWFHGSHEKLPTYFYVKITHFPCMARRMVAHFYYHGDFKLDNSDTFSRAVENFHQSSRNVFPKVSSQLTPSNFENANKPRNIRKFRQFWICCCLLY